VILLGGLAFRRTMDDRVEVMVEELGEVERRRPERVFVGIGGPGISWLGRPMIMSPGSGTARWSLRISAHPERAPYEHDP